MEQGGSYSFYCEAESALPLSYQWYTRMKGETVWNKIDGATETMLTGVVATSDPAGSVEEFQCVVTNGRRTVNSETAELTVLAAKPTITASFYGTTVNVKINPPQNQRLTLILQHLAGIEWRNDETTQTLVNSSAHSFSTVVTSGLYYRVYCPTLNIYSNEITK